MQISIQTTIHAPLEKVWSVWTTPSDITQWNFASQDWCCPKAQINLVVGGEFNYRMEEKNGSVGFDFQGKFILIDENSSIEYVLADDRKVSISFAQTQEGILVSQTFDTEEENTVELQKQGWQSILDNFKEYVQNKY